MTFVMNEYTPPFVIGYKNFFCSVYQYLVLLHLLSDIDVIYNNTFHQQRSEDDVSQFDTKFTRQIPIDSPEESTLSESANLMFQVSVSHVYSKLSLFKVFAI